MVTPVYIRHESQRAFKDFRTLLYCGVSGLVSGLTNANEANTSDIYRHNALFLPVLSLHACKNRPSAFESDLCET